MKRLLLLFLALSLLGGLAFAQDLGLTVGLEFGIDDFKETADTAYLRPLLIYENDTLVDNLELYAEIGVPFWFNPELWVGVDLNLIGSYNLGLAPASTLTFELESQNFFPAADDAQSPKFWWAGEGKDQFISVLVPRIIYTHDLNDFSLYGLAELQMLISKADFWGNSFDPLDYIVLDTKVGFEAEAGYALELQVSHALKDFDGSTVSFSWMGIQPSYTSGPLHLEVYFGFPPRDIKEKGINIHPRAEYNIMDNLLAYFTLFINSVGAENDDVSYGILLGAKYSF